jgi:cytochrome c553
MEQVEAHIVDTRSSLRVEDKMLVMCARCHGKKYKTNCFENIRNFFLLIQITLSKEKKALK